MVTINILWFLQLRLLSLHLSHRFFFSITLQCASWIFWFFQNPFPFQLYFLFLLALGSVPYERSTPSCYVIQDKLCTYVYPIASLQQILLSNVARASRKR